MVQRKVGSGEFLNESDVVGDSAQGLKIEAWLRTVAVPAYDAIKAGRWRALTVDQVRVSLAARFERAIKSSP